MPAQSDLKTIFAAGWQRFALVSFISILLFGSCFFAGYEEIIEDKIGRPFLFWARGMADLAPNLDPKIKILAFDNESVAKLGMPESLDPTVWGSILQSVTLAKPDAILIDLIYGARRSPADAEQLRKIFSTLPNISSAAHLSRSRIEFRDRLALDKKQFFPGESAYEFLKEHSHNFDGLTPYGPSKELSEAIQSVGHISYRSPGWFAPIAALGNSTAIKHLSLNAASKIEFVGSKLHINGVHSPLNKRSEALINWSSKEEYFKRTRKILGTSEAGERGVASSLIAANDIVIILPAMYTGNTDFKETSIGELPGGYALVSAVNSVLTGKWLQVRSPGIAGILLASLLGASLGLISSAKRIVYAIVFGNFCFIVLTIAAFFWSETSLNWVFACAAFNFASLIQGATSAVSSEVKTLQINNALRGVVSPEVLKKIIANPDSFNLESLEAVLTVMFVDFVGFSSAAERLTPNRLFESLKNSLGLISEIVHRHGGIVDKTLGDGLIGFFGLNPLTQAMTTDHADKALACAKEIQKALAVRCRDHFDDDQPNFPARIGLNSGPVYVGNIGDQHNCEITVIGHTVNMAKRYEDSAEPFKIMLGTNTKMRLGETANSSHLSLRRAQIKHHDELVDVYECDPFSDSPNLYSEALRAYRRFAGISRIKERHHVPQTFHLELWKDNSLVGKVFDYSLDGLAVDLKEYFANKVKFSFDLKLLRSVGSESQVIQSFSDFSAEVRWGRPTPSGYRHGLSLMGDGPKRMSEIRIQLENNQEGN